MMSSIHAGMIALPILSVSIGAAGLRVKLALMLRLIRQKHNPNEFIKLADRACRFVGQRFVTLLTGSVRYVRDSPLE